MTTSPHYKPKHLSDDKPHKAKQIQAKHLDPISISNQHHHLPTLSSTTHKNSHLPFSTSYPQISKLLVPNPQHTKPGSGLPPLPFTLLCSVCTAAAGPYVCEGSGHPVQALLYETLFTLLVSPRYLSPSHDQYHTYVCVRVRTNIRPVYVPAARDSW